MKNHPSDTPNTVIDETIFGPHCDGGQRRFHAGVAAVAGNPSL